MGQTENTRCCKGLMHKNGQHIVIDFAHAESCFTWPICVRNLQPALVYMWIQCLWRIISVMDLIISLHWVQRLGQESNRVPHVVVDIPL
jgi:hypothetical protein